MADEEKTVGEKIAEELDTLEPRVEAKDWTFSDGITTKTYVQKPLGFFGKIEFFSLIGETVDSMGDSGKALNISDMFGTTANMDSLVAIVARVASYTPETLKEAYCIALAVPRNEREWAKWVMDDHLTDDEGFELMERFVDQNGDAMRDFFGEKGSTLLKRVTKKFKKAPAADAPAPSSKSSKRTRQSTAA